jgi:hypothetical protein
MRLHPPARRGTRAALALLALVPARALANDDPQLGQSRGDPIPVPAQAPRLHAPNEPKAGGAMQGRIFVNFDGESLNDGWDDSTTNTTQIGELAGNFAAYGAGAKRDATMQAVRDDWAAYNVIITESRPASGDYTMCMVGPTNPFGGGVLGIAPLDCNDSQTPNNIVYAFHSANDQFDASTQATTIGQEVAHSYGLEHVDEPGDVMNPYNAGGDPAFTDNCIGVVGGVVCGDQHAAECGSGSQQNSHRELLTLFGTSSPDTMSPTVTITAPADGATFDVGSTFEITVEASDDVDIDQVVLYNNDEEIETDGSSPYGWTVNEAPAGNYVFYVEAYDTAGNVSMSDTVSVNVGDAPAEGDGGGGDSGGGDSGGGDSASAGDDGGEAGGDGDAGNDGSDDGGGAYDDGGDGALPPDFGLDGRGGDESCACTTDRSADAWAWSLLLIGVVRRRSRRV